MRYEPEKLRGISSFERPYLEYNLRYHPLGSDLDKHHLLVFFENSHEYVFDVPRTLVKHFIDGELESARLRWLTVLERGQHVGGPNPLVVLDSDGYN